MKLLLTSAGISNTSIRNALIDLLGKLIAESTAHCIPTAVYAIPEGSTRAWHVIRTWSELGWKAFGVLELTAPLGTRREPYFASPHVRRKTSHKTSLRAGGGAEHRPPSRQGRGSPC